MKRSFIALRPYPLTGPRALALTLLLTGLAALVSLAAAPLIYRFPFALFFVTVTISAWFGGFRQGLYSSVLAVVFADYYLLPPRGQWSLAPAELLRIGLWLVLSLGIAFMSSRLSGSKARLGRTLAGIAEGVFILDNNWNLAYINNAGTQLLDKSGQEGVGRSFWDVVPETKGSVTEQQFKRCAAEGVPVQFESHWRQRYFQVRAYPVPEGISVFIQDITPAKEREAHLRSILDRLTNAHRAAQMGTFEWNIKTNELIFSNEAHRNHGWTPEQWDSKFESWVKTLHPEDSAGVLAKIQKALEEKSEYDADFRVLWPNGEIHWLAGHGRVVLDEQGNTAGIIGICSDITHRRQEEEALQRTEKLAMAGRLAAAIAHEINNPLEAVTNLIYLLRHDTGTALDRDELLRMADEQLARVNHIAKQTLGFYRDRSVPEAVDVVQTLEELLSILRSRLNAKRISIEREYEKTGPVNGFSGELRQVFSNLLTNAMDASYSGGKLILRVKPDAPPNGRPGVLVRIEIEDFGTGIQPRDQPRIFEPFFTTKPDFGTGLGLWVTRELVEKHGGTINFRSTCEGNGTGTCFSVILSASEISQQTSAAAD
jgi:PAS domain S-box-containing protein